MIQKLIKSPKYKYLVYYKATLTSSKTYWSTLKTDRALGANGQVNAELVKDCIHDAIHKSGSRVTDVDIYRADCISDI